MNDAVSRKSKNRDDGIDMYSEEGMVVNRNEVPIGDKAATKKLEALEKTIRDKDV